ncbi:hypothetical protein BN938_0395 [Mucinivorans hirudinis]|uniref:DUF1896 domain-containing protein n=1 Tax=Mucinivorans hirudinis TaxID=1433126 RepID=A0A060R6B6_9BACT|nr:hypothetical protein BN938_0395 [Mucinivorans hirudinis]
MRKSHQFTEASYFKGILFVTLEENHPETPIDPQFIESRSELAEQAYEDAVREGKISVEAQEIALRVLLSGLHFSKTSIIKDILNNEFSEEVESDRVPEFALEILPELKSVFEHYNIDDAFAETPEYDHLYTELTGAIHIYFEDYGV